MTTNEKSETPPEGWPRCEPEQVQVMLLGTFHMNNPGQDKVNIKADDVLADDRQNQLETLVDHLADWKPDRVAVEPAYDEFEAVNDSYEKYRSGEYAYDREENDDDSKRRSEVVQVGFRLADRLGHEQVFPIDEFPEEPDSDPFEDRETDTARKTSVTPPDPKAMQREGDERLASSTLLEYFQWINSEDKLRDNHDLMFDTGIRTADDTFGSPVFIAYWYDRNLRMVHHLWRALEQGDERMLLVVGTGHIRVLRHLFNEAPMFCPVSPLPYLSSDS